VIWSNDAVQDWEVGTGVDLPQGNRPHYGDKLIRLMKLKGHAHKPSSKVGHEI
jgi:hypothetical protein